MMELCIHIKSKLDNYLLNTILSIHFCQQKMLGIHTCLASDMINLGRNYFFKFCRRFILLLLFVFYFYHYHFESRDLYMKKPMTIYKKSNNTFVSWRHCQSHFHSQNDCVFVYFMSVSSKIALSLLFLVLCSVRMKVTL